MIDPQGVRLIDGEFRVVAEYKTGMDGVDVEYGDERIDWRLLSPISFRYLGRLPITSRGLNELSRSLAPVANIKKTPYFEIEIAPISGRNTIGSLREVPSDITVVFYMKNTPVNDLDLEDERY
tara:strand:+ start:1386 stop:1754 length:369 start_codon:yes stop_codon:yes gene_type:complete